jgi:hypothetical protein
MITGFPRSGTTLLAETLARHPDVHIPNETHFFFYPSARLLFGRPAAFRWLRPAALRRDLAGSLAAFVREHDHVADILDRHGGRDAFIARVRRDGAGSMYDVFEQLLAWLGERTGRRVVGEKTPGQEKITAALGERLPELRVLHIVRDPRDVAVSQRNVPWGHAGASFTAVRWRRSQRRAERTRRRLGERFLLVRYEDFVRRPTAELRRICDFVGVTFSEELLRDSTHATFDLAVEPWKRQSSETISQSRIGRWRDVLAEPELDVVEGLLGRQLDALGYERSRPPRPLWRRVVLGWRAHVAAGAAFLGDRLVPARRRRTAPHPS